MASKSRDGASERAVRKLTETIREAAEREDAVINQTIALIERLHAVQADFQAMKRPGGLPADKPFFDELSSQ